MASEIAISPPETTVAPESKRAARVAKPRPTTTFVVLDALASLRLTVALFVLATVLVFVGTLAQSEEGMWLVMGKYFRSFACWVGVWVFFPRSWFPQMWTDAGFVWGNAAFPFPGGATIGGLMMVNLVAAHVTRFKIAAKGARLTIGWLAIAGAALFGMLVIFGGQFDQVLREQPLVPPKVVWAITLSFFSLPGLYLLFASTNAKAAASEGERNWLFTLGMVSLFVAIAGSVVAWRYMPDPSAMRTLWQLIQGTAVGVAIYAASWIVFERRAGIVAIHAGVALLMFYEAFVTMSAVEERMPIVEGRTARFAMDTRATELVFLEEATQLAKLAVDAPVVPGVAKDEKVRREIVVPTSLLQDGRRHEIPGLPFEVQLVAWHPNSVVRDVRLGERPTATAGMGLEWEAVSKSTGAGASGGAEDMPSGYFKFFKKGSEQDLGAYLATTYLGYSDVVATGDQSWRTQLRFKRSYKDYQITLKDVEKKDYVGTGTPRDYSSYVHVVDASRSVDRDVRIHMNEPMRYGGETFYQSGYVALGDGVEQTTLQVVTNVGWMAPYVACMIVVVGMLGHFSIALVEFLLKSLHAKETKTAELVATAAKDRVAALGAKHAALPIPAAPAPKPGVSFVSLALGALLAMGIVGYGCSRYFTPTKPVREFDLGAFGDLPIAANGRVKPIDSLARTTLTVVSNNDTAKTGKYGDADRKTISAVEWLLDVVTDDDKAKNYEIFRVENDQLIRELGLKLKPQNFRYSFAELEAGIPVIQREMERLGSMGDKYVPTAYENEISELSRRIKFFSQLRDGFQTIRMIDDEAGFADFAKLPPARQQQLLAAVFPRFQELKSYVESRAGMPLIVPLTDTKMASALNKSGGWSAFPVAAAMQEILSLVPREEAGDIAPVMAWAKILNGWQKQDADKFNSAVAQYGSWIKDNRTKLDEYDAGRVPMEARFNRAATFSLGMTVYLLAFAVSCLGMIVARKRLSAVAFWMILGAAIVHTITLALRIYISGRPPITNLYGTAVFISWFAVVLGLALETAYRINFGNLVGSFCGYMGLMIASYLSLDGDTIEVMQAVLDTQFWLATHVVAINTGYAAAFVAGMLGIAYLVFNALRFIGAQPAGSDAEGDELKILARLVYGVTCFALFFSAFGTILGGLWADDSWGRFWGWDPKENGALMIVLWNALVLHARWGGVVRDRGLASLAVFGNIIVAWSWFGVNQLGIGLHSYGFNKGVLTALAWTAGIHLALLLLAFIPNRKTASPSPEVASE